MAEVVTENTTQPYPLSHELGRMKSILREIYYSTKKDPKSEAEAITQHSLLRSLPSLLESARSIGPTDWTIQPDEMPS